MLYRTILATLIASGLLLSQSVNAEQMQQIKSIDVHYSAFNSTFLTPEVARTYNLERNSYQALLNLTVLDNSQLGTPAIEAKISGTATNLVGQIQQLEFQFIKEADAMYYIAPLKIEDQTTLRFNISVDAGLKGRGVLKFHQKFYSEE
ncbi:DUF4426 domain-containing protein [Vibrio sp. RC27]